MIDTNKCHSDPRFNNNHLYLAFLIHNSLSTGYTLPFLKKYSFHVILFYIFLVSESSHSRRVLNLKVTRVVTFENLRFAIKTALLE